jgi:hypothetical protein
MTRYSVNILTAIFCGLLLCTGTDIARARPQVGDVEKIQHSASATFQQQTRNLTHKAPVFFEDLLQTGPAARLSVILDDGSDLTLGENSRLLIDDFVYSPRKKTGRMALKALQGAFLFIGGRVEYIPDAEVSITTPGATLGIRGTSVWGGPIDNAYGILTLDGEVTVSNNAGSVILTAGQGTMISSANIAPSAPVQWPQEKVWRAIDMIRFSQ